MSRTVVLKTIEKMTEEELKETSRLTELEIILKFETIASYYDGEIEFEECEEAKELFSLITTSDGKKVHVAKTKYLALCSDRLLAYLVEKRIKNYQRATLTDVTCMMRDEEWYLEGTEQRQVTNFEGDIVLKERNLKILIPAKKEGRRLFFFDDMD